MEGIETDEDYAARLVAERNRIVNRAMIAWVILGLMMVSWSISGCITDVWFSKKVQPRQGLETGVGSRVEGSERTSGPPRASHIETYRPIWQFRPDKGVREARLPCGCVIERPIVEEE